MGSTSIAAGRVGEIETKPASSGSTTCRDGYLGTLVVIPSGSNDDEIALRIVTGLGPTPEQCVDNGYVGGCIVARRALRFIPHRPIDLPIFMSAACRDIACNPDETCLDGVCVSATLSDPIACAQPNGCKPVDAGAQDAKGDVSDAGGADASDASSDVADASAADTSADEGEVGSTCVSPVAGGACDTFQQCGCGATQTCSVVGDTTACIPAGTRKLNESCDNVQLCAPGLDCFYSVTPPGACKRYCQTDATCVGTGSKCQSVNDSKGKPIPGVGFCTSGCALENPAAVCGPLACVVLGTAATDCLPSGSGIGPGTCTGVLDCAPGYLCSGGKDCRKWCRLGKTDCGDAGVCTTANVTVAGVGYGVCL